MGEPEIFEPFSRAQAKYIRGNSRPLPAIHIRCLSVLLSLILFCQPAVVDFVSLQKSTGTMAVRIIAAETMKMSGVGIIAG